jgi:hypothetical protein
MKLRDSICRGESNDIVPKTWGTHNMHGDMYRENDETILRCKLEV